MGKGKGKGGIGQEGGCLDQIGDCIQCVAATICCLLVSGPILTIIGIAFIVSAFDDNRTQRIDEFNVAVDNWRNGKVDNWDAASASDWAYTARNSCQGRASGNLAQVTSRETARDPDALGSEQEEAGTFAGYTPVLYADEDPSSVGTLSASGTNNCQITFTITYQGEQVAEVEAPQQTQTAQGFNDICTRRTQSRRQRQSSFGQQDSDIRSCAQRCEAQGGAPSGTTYSNFRCVTQERPAAVCVRVQQAGGGWAEADGTLPDMPSGARGSGCYLSIGARQWDNVRTEQFSGGGTLEVEVLVRNENDPYLYFLDISQGTKDFGLKTSEKLIIGFTCLGLGILLTACICGVCCIIFKFARGFAGGNKPPRPANPVGGGLYDVAAKYGNYLPGGAKMNQGGAYGGQPPPQTGTYGGGYGSTYGGSDGHGGGGGGGYESKPPPGYPSDSNGYNNYGGGAGYGGSYGNAGHGGGKHGHGGGHGGKPPGYPQV